MEKGRSSRCRAYSEVAAFRREFIALMGGTAAKERCRHSIASPARARNLSGILGPRILPVLRSITSSDFVGHSTGMSAGVARVRQDRRRGGRPERTGNWECPPPHGNAPSLQRPLQSCRGVRYFFQRAVPDFSNPKPASINPRFCRVFCIGDIFGSSSFDVRCEWMWVVCDQLVTIEMHQSRP